MWTSRFRAFWAVAFAVATFGCGGSVLSRDDAAQQISKHQKFQEQGMVQRDILDIKVGQFCAVANGSPDFKSWLNHHDPSSFMNWEQGYLEMDGIRKLSPYDDKPEVCVSAQTAYANSDGGGLLSGMMALGSRYWVWNQRVPEKFLKPKLLSASGGTYQVLRRELQEVSWISDTRGTNVAEVEYKWKWVTTKLGQSLRFIDDIRPTTGRARFLRHDDGSWSLEDLNLRSGSPVALNQ